MMIMNNSSFINICACSFFTCSNQHINECVKVIHVHMIESIIAYVSYYYYSQCYDTNVSTTVCIPHAVHFMTCLHHFDNSSHTHTQNTSSKSHRIAQNHAGCDETKRVEQEPKLLTQHMMMMMMAFLLCEQRAFIFRCRQH